MTEQKIFRIATLINMCQDKLPLQGSKLSINFFIVQEDTNEAKQCHQRQSRNPK
uniref:Uncharacterized protein n=1 Tax=Arundo donax TaxID=35708 RepID=A0A0A8ZHW0_ARUDO